MAHLHSTEIEISLIIPVKKCFETLEKAVQEVHFFLTQRFPHAFEIILVPNPAPHDHKDQSIIISEKLSKQFTEVRHYPHLYPAGKGAAIKTGFQNSRGRWIFFTDADLPYDLKFFDQAIKKLRSGYDLVTGNRRLPESHFNIPVDLLKLAYRRHRLGLGYNLLVRLFLPISTTDTQAGIKAFSRRLAIEVFKRQICPGFLFDLEIFLTAIGFNYQYTELPVTLHLNSEKSTVRVLRECIAVAQWLTRIAWKNFRHGYRCSDGVTKESRPSVNLISRYRHTQFSIRWFLKLRWLLTPYQHMTSRLPIQGKILDLGCGHGLFTLMAALESSTRNILGIDHDENRIILGQQATQDLPNVKMETGNFIKLQLEPKSYSAVAMIDVIHYFKPEVQESLIQQAYHLLEENGILLIREVNPQAGIISFWNRCYERIATQIGFTQAGSSNHWFRTPAEWISLLIKNGFRVKSERCSSFLFADILYICEKSGI